LVSIDPRTTENDAIECLKRCLGFLQMNKRDLILDYYVYEGHAKIVHHQTMAQELAISKGALRGQAHQIRSKLEVCVRQCLQDHNETERSSKRIVSSGVLGWRRQP